MTRAIVVAFHKYTPFGSEFYEPILSFFLNQIQKYKDEYDTIYIVDSTWGISPASHNLPDNVVVIKVDPSLRYYDAYKKALLMIKEDLVLFVDNDMVVYKPFVIADTFAYLRTTDPNKWTAYDVVSIYDTIGTYKTDKLNGKNKFCPYWFAAKKETLMKYLDVDWSPDMPYCETLGHLTEAMLNDGLRPYEFEEDKSNCLFNGTQDGEKSKDLGYYHIRAGSTPAYLLATKKYGDRKTYDDYLKNQPQGEYLRQFAWYHYMIEQSHHQWKDMQQGHAAILEVMNDMNIESKSWFDYVDRFREYHGLT